MTECFKHMTYDPNCPACLEEKAAEKPSSAGSACSISLPKITDELVEQFYPWLIADDGDGYTWNQAAVDFACVLKGECYRRSGKQ